MARCEWVVEVPTGQAHSPVEESERGESSRGDRSAKLAYCEISGFILVNAASALRFSLLSLRLVRLGFPR